MKTASLRAVLTTGVVLLCIVMTLTYQAGAMQNARRPTVVATVNLEMVMEKLQQRADATISLQQMQSEMRQALERREQELKQLEAKILAMEANSPERQAAQEELAQATLRFRHQQAFDENKLDIELALLRQDLYRSIKQALAQMAPAAGYDMVLVDDSIGELMARPDGRTSRNAQISQQISSRRLLYASRTLDITDELVDRMNNAYKAAGAGRR